MFFEVSVSANAEGRCVISGGELETCNSQLRVIVPCNEGEMG